MKRLIVVDISSFIFRAFYAIKPLTAPDGTPVNSLRGVYSMLVKLISDYQPTHMLIARDLKEGSFRNEMYPAYKAHRPPPPEDLIPQFDLIKKLVDLMEISQVSQAGFEADDIIGSVVTQWKDDFDEVFIASGDKDLMQFIDDKVKMLDTMKSIVYGPAEVFEKMRVHPNQIVDYLSMLGDASDNIPGMKGIGAKGASELLSKFETFEGCMENSETFTNKRVKNAFENHIEDGLLSKKLIQIPTDIKLEVTSADSEFKFVATDDLMEFLTNLGFKTALKQLQQFREIDGSSDTGEQDPLVAVTAIKTVAEYTQLLGEVSKHKEISFLANYTSEKLVDQEIDCVGLNFNDENYFIHFNEENGKITQDHYIDLWQITFADKNKHMITHNVKREYAYALTHTLNFECGFDDVMLMSFVLDPSSKSNLDFLIERKLPSVGFQEATFANKSLYINMLYKNFVEGIKTEQLSNIYSEIDKPLVSVLAEMELHGVKVNVEFLNELEDSFRGQLAEIEKEIISMTDVEGVNLKSPKQVGVLLFENLQLPIIKKTKTGASTDSSVLEELDSRNLSPVPALILRYRELDKLVSTYVSVLPHLVNENTGKIHTTFNQNVAATGRLSSDKPNLQNIPIRTKNGKHIRKGFIADKGNLLLAADYSQVELRLLAHFSNDTTMIEAFNNDIDIHTQTASEILSVPVDEITSVQRSSAKAVNFGLMYGQSSFGLSKALRISRKEAKEYITNYFERFHKVKSYLDSLKELAEETGYSETYHGRKRFLPDIRSTNRTVKSFAERMAVNSPIQGTAADIIKLAMIEIDSEMKKQKLSSTMVLQVHDELIFEVPEDELDIMKALVRKGMEGAVSLQVPLRVDMGIGVNWMDLK